jgi:hypothetical protein
MLKKSLPPSGNGTPSVSNLPANKNLFSHTSSKRN